MSSHWSGESAKILQFPIGGRRGVADRRPAAKPAEELESLRLPKVSFGDAWYHDAAIQEAAGAGKR